MTDIAPFLDHGGRVEAARAMFGGDGWIDLSTGVAPWSYPVERAHLALDRLPEPGALAGLEAAAARAFGLDDRTGVVAVPGTDLAMRLLAPLLGARRPAVVTPGYAGHRAAWPDATPLAFDGVERAAAAHDRLILSSPANPDGARLDPAAIARLVGVCPLLLDQAYADPDPAPVPDAADRLVVLRSFGKFYGLPGVRLGFVLAGAALATRLRALLGDWPVSGPAIAIGTAAYRDRAWQEAQHARIADAGHRLDAVLARAGLRVVGSAPLFRLVEGRDGGEALFRRCARAAILTRPFAAEPNRLRIGLPADAAAAHRLATALQESPS